MAEITITIPNAVLQRVLDGIGARFGYTRNQLPSETKGDFAKRMLLQSVKQWIKDGEGMNIEGKAFSDKVANELDIDSKINLS